MEQKTYQKVLKNEKIKRPIFMNVLRAFIMGGIVGLIAQGLLTLYLSVLDLEKATASSLMSITLVFIASILTGFGLYDKIGQFAGAGIISSDESSIKVTRATIGKVVDPGLTDPQDLGRAMAPAAASTLRQHLIDFQIDPAEYDLILTGDLSKYGGKVFLDILKEWNINIEKNYHDCGMLVYDVNKQSVFAGGSGCGCSA